MGVAGEPRPLDGESSDSHRGGDHARVISARHQPSVRRRGLRSCGSGSAASAATSDDDGARDRREPGMARLECQRLEERFGLHRADEATDGQTAPKNTAPPRQADAPAMSRHAPSTASIRPRVVVWVKPSTSTTGSSIGPSNPPRTMASRPTTSSTSPTTAAMTASGAKRRTLAVRPPGLAPRPAVPRPVRDDRLHDSGWLPPRQAPARRTPLGGSSGVRRCSTWLLLVSARCSRSLTDRPCDREPEVASSIGTKHAIGRGRRITRAQ